MANISSQSNGRLTIELPRNSIDSTKQGTNADDTYAVFEDRQRIVAEETTNNSQVRTLVIDFDKGTEKIEIVGPHVVPEFGASYCSNGICSSNHRNHHSEYKIQ